MTPPIFFQPNAQKNRTPQLAMDEAAVARCRNTGLRELAAELDVGLNEPARGDRHSFRGRFLDIMGLGSGG